MYIAVLKYTSNYCKGEAHCYFVLVKLQYKPIILGALDRVCPSLCSSHILQELSSDVNAAQPMMQQYRVAQNQVKSSLLFIHLHCQFSKYTFEHFCYRARNLNYS